VDVNVSATNTYSSAYLDLGYVIGTIEDINVVASGNSSDASAYINGSIDINQDIFLSANGISANAVLNMQDADATGVVNLVSLDAQNGGNDQLYLNLSGYINSMQIYADDASVFAALRLIGSMDVDDNTVRTLNIDAFGTSQVDLEIEQTYGAQALALHHYAYGNVDVDAEAGAEVNLVYRDIVAKNIDLTGMVTGAKFNLDLAVTDFAGNVTYGMNEENRIYISGFNTEYSTINFGTKGNYVINTTAFTGASALTDLQNTAKSGLAATGSGVTKYYFGTVSDGGGNEDGYLFYDTNKSGVTTMIHLDGVSSVGLDATQLGYLQNMLIGTNNILVV
jgi:hypothetical protein